MNPTRPTATERDEICETVYRYALGIDTRDWALYRSIFADELRMDFASYNAQPASTMTADAWVARVKPLFTGLAASQHTMTNPVVTVEASPSSQRAHCLMYMQAVHVLDVLDHGDGDDWFTIGGYYDDRLVKIDDRWSIEAVTLTVLWRRGDESIMRLATERGHQRLSRDDT